MTIEFETNLDKYTKYNSSKDKDNKHYKIMLLIGNGFDIKVLKELNSQDDKCKTTSYTDFFQELTNSKSEINIYKNFEEIKNNYIYQRMRIASNDKKENWSDFECILKEASENGEYNEKIELDLNQVRKDFALYLNYVCDPDTLMKLDRKVNQGYSFKDSFNKYQELYNSKTITLKEKEKKFELISKNDNLPYRIFSKFIYDLNEEDANHFDYLKKARNYDVFDWKIINFNFTNIFDNYIYRAMEPHPHKMIDTNGYFFLRGMKVISTYLNVGRIIHPHGNINIPRSMLFGYNSDITQRTLINKEYYGEYNSKYSYIMDCTDIFIIFGLSLGVTDVWWWSKIKESLKTDKQKKLIIYWYDKNHLEARNQFFEVTNCNKGERSKLKSQILVILQKDDLETFKLSTDP